MIDPRILMRQPYSNSGFLGRYHTSLCTISFMIRFTTAVDTNNKQQSTKSGSGRLGGGGGGNTRTTTATPAAGMMALIAAATTTAAAVATVAAAAMEVWRRGGPQGWHGCVGCRQMVVARKLQKPFGDFT